MEMGYWRWVEWLGGLSRVGGRSVQKREPRGVDG